MLPEGEVAAEPVRRLTPLFHDITIENVRSVNSGTAGVIVGLPESPVKNVVLKNVDIQAKKGMNIAYANVRGDELQGHGERGREHYGCAECEAGGEVADQQRMVGESAA